MRPLSLPRLLGYDPAILGRLPRSQQHEIDGVAVAWLWACTLLALPVGYALWLVEHALWLALLACSVTWLLLLNFLRLTIAAGGLPPHFAARRALAQGPSLGPLFALGLLALLFAQPTQLALGREALDGPIAQHRRHLLAQHERTLATLADPRDDAPSAAYETTIARRAVHDDGYRWQLARCEFVVLRLQQMWRQPALALGQTGVYCLLVLLPALGARALARRSLRDYERMRWKSSRSRIARGRREAAAEVRALLSAWPSYAAAAAPLDARAGRLDGRRRACVDAESRRS